MISHPALSERQGPRPATSPIIPHRQLDQNAPAALQEALWQRMRSLPGVETGPSLVSVPGARATFVADGCELGPACACMVGREFAHIHPASDGSLHVTLPDGLREEAVAKGWAEPHPLAGTGKAPETVVMLYGPRDGAEFCVIWALVEASHGFACGRSG